MKAKNLPDLKEEEQLPFHFKQPSIADEQIHKHWDAIAKQLFTAPVNEQVPSTSLRIVE